MTFDLRGDDNGLQTSYLSFRHVRFLRRKIVLRLNLVKSHEDRWLAPALTPAQRTRQMVLHTFREPAKIASEHFAHLSHRQWTALLTWLDISGLALYFLDQLAELGRPELLPPWIQQRLQQNLQDNTKRLTAMTNEAAAISSAFQEAGLLYAMLKGFSLWPDAVPRLALRSQLDLDFLIAEENAPRARYLLEARGYILHAVSGQTWEFKTVATGEMKLSDLYRQVHQRTVELHLEASSLPSSETSNSLLHRRQEHHIADAVLPVLAPVDIFIGQAMHLYKHLSRDAMRTSHLLEFYRHLMARREDADFWESIQSQIAENDAARLALGVALLLTCQQLGLKIGSVPLTSYIEQLPSRVRMWVEQYGSRVVYADFPGSKLNLILQREVDTAIGLTRRPLRRALLPLRLPPAITPTPLAETLPARLRRHRKQLWYMGFRLRFHVVEGLRYLLENRRWHRLMAQRNNPCDDKPRAGEASAPLPAATKR